MIDKEILDKIVVAGKISSADTVIEIGPGFGFLTKKLAERARRVIAIEIDLRATKALQEELRDDGNVIILNQDALKFNFAEYLNNKKYFLIANIPYQITGKIFEKFLFSGTPPQRAVLLMQREVGERILAKGEKHTFLSVVLQMAYTVSQVEKVSREKFYPVPRVDSTVVSFEFKRNLPPEFINFVALVFAHPKKKALNNLAAAVFKKYDSKSIFLELGIDLNVRPGDIKLDDWLNLGKKLSLLV